MLANLNSNYYACVGAEAGALAQDVLKLQDLAMQKLRKMYAEM